MARKKKQTPASLISTTTATTATTADETILIQVVTNGSKYRCKVLNTETGKFKYLYFERGPAVEKPTMESMVEWLNEHIGNNLVLIESPWHPC